MLGQLDVHEHFVIIGELRQNLLGKILQERVGGVSQAQTLIADFMRMIW